MSPRLCQCWRGTRARYDDLREVLSTGLDHTDMFRVLYGELCGDLCDLAEYETHLQVTEALCLNDCKSVADALLAAGSAAEKTSEDKRLRIEVSMIKQRLSRSKTQFQWMEGATMPTDVLTKGIQRCWRKDGKLVNESFYDTMNGDEQTSDSVEKLLRVCF